MGRLRKYWISIKHIKRISNVVHHAIHRCHDPKCHNYNAYGGRGIKVWDEWRKYPQWFMAYICTLPNWDVLGLTLDRINNNKGYTPGNLRWVSVSEQAKNTQRYTGLGCGTKTKCLRCNISFTRRREYQKFCSCLCAAYVGAAKRWAKHNGR